MRDLPSYICIFNECQKPQSAFRTSDDWTAHILQERLLVEWVFCMHDPVRNTIESLLFANEDELDEYMNRVGPDQDDSKAVEQLPVYLQIIQRPKIRMFKNCRFCGSKPEGMDHLLEDPSLLDAALREYIGKHLHKLAIYLLPWDRYFGSFVLSNDTEEEKDIETDNKDISDNTKR